jgi:anti-sigma regulatory factor (Ser/Thr protein kinase)
MLSSTRWSHATLLRAHPDSASTARDFVSVYLRAHGFEYLVDDVQLVVSELATNAVNHAKTPFTLTLCLREGLIHLDLADEGDGLPVVATPTEQDTNGRGLMLVERLSDEWGSTRRGDGTKNVWASFVV